MRSAVLTPTLRTMSSVRQASVPPASFEMLLCSILSAFFNEGRMDTVAYAHIGKYSENVYWDKASSLLDQMACAVGGLITIDFMEPASLLWKIIRFQFPE